MSGKNVNLKLKTFPGNFCLDLAKHWCGTLSVEMNFLMQNLFSLKFTPFDMHLSDSIPRVSKHYLILVAALVWTFAGGMLLFRGLIINNPLPAHWKIKMLSCIVAGLLFFRLLFDRISAKHVLRIKNLPQVRPVIFSFFNTRSYLMMFSMISLGITLRLTGIVSPEYLSLMYITMGIPLLMSSIRFYSTFFKS